MKERSNAILDMKIDKTLIKLLREYRDLLKIMNPGVRKHLMNLLGKHPGTKR